MVAMKNISRDGEMRVELPVLKQCFCCLPLRYELLVLSYFKLILSLVMLTQFVFIYIGQNAHNLTSASALEDDTFFIPMVVDLGLTSIFIVATHKKSLKHFVIYHYYSLFLVLVSLVAVLMSALDIDPYFVQHMMVSQLVWLTYYAFDIYVGPYELFIIAMLSTFVQLYIALLVRREMQNLKKSKDELASQDVAKV